MGTLRSSAGGRCYSGTVEAGAMHREDGEGLRTFGGDNPTHEEITYLLRPDSYPKPLHWRVRDEKGL